MINYFCLPNKLCSNMDAMRSVLERVEDKLHVMCYVRWSAYAGFSLIIIDCLNVNDLKALLGKGWTIYTHEFQYTVLHDPIET